MDDFKAYCNRVILEEIQNFVKEHNEQIKKIINTRIDNEIKKFKAESNEETKNKQ